MKTTMTREQVIDAVKASAMAVAGIAVFYILICITA